MSNRTTTYRFRTYCLIVALLALLGGTDAFAQKKAARKKKLPAVKENIETVKPGPEINAAPDANSGAKPSQGFEPRIGLAGGMALPMGEVGTVLSSGIGGYLYADFSLNSIGFIGNLNTKNIYTYAGLAAGIMPFGTKLEGASLSIIPIEPYLRVNFRNQSKFEPFIVLGFGVGMVSSNRAATTTLPAKSVSSLDAHLVTGLGGMYKASEKIEIFATAGYEIFFEQVSGSFLNFRAGLFYKL